MDYAHSFAISGAGMAIERLRVEAAAMNLANAHTVQAPGLPAYRPLRAVAHAPAASFASLLEQQQALPAAALEAIDAGPRLVHEPGHPRADERGFVAYPAVDTATEMVTLMSAMRCYEANVAAINTTRSLALRTLEIGKGS